MSNAEHCNYGAVFPPHETAFNSFCEGKEILRETCNNLQFPWIMFPVHNIFNTFHLHSWQPWLPLPDQPGACSLTELTSAQRLQEVYTEWSVICITNAKNRSLLPWSPLCSKPGTLALLGAAPQGAGAQQSHSLVIPSLLPRTPRSCAIASLPTLWVQTMLEHLTTRKPAGVCTDLFNHLLIACTLTVLKHLKATNTAFPLSSTPFEGTKLALSKFVTAE